MLNVRSVVMLLYNSRDRAKWFQSKENKEMKLKSVILALSCIGTVSLLTGCAASTHPIVEADQTCMTCHNEPQTYDYTVVPEASYVQSELEVKTSAPTVKVCTPHFTSEDGLNYVSQVVDEVEVKDGVANVSLGFGLWTLVVNDGSGENTKLVYVEAEGVNSLNLGE